MLEVIRYPLQYPPTTVTPSESKIEKILREVERCSDVDVLVFVHATALISINPKKKNSAYV